MSHKDKEQCPVDPLNLFVKFVPYDIDDAGLESLFQGFGPILSAKIMVCALL